MIKFILALFAFLPLISCASDKNINTNILSGSWSNSCEFGTTIKSTTPDHFLIEINKNQIYISAKAEADKNSIRLMLVEPEDLGPGGMHLKWKYFSRDIPIAQITEISDRTLKFNWLGFYDLESNSKKWVTEPDFASEGSEIFSRCLED